MPSAAVVTDIIGAIDAHRRAARRRHAAIGLVVLTLTLWSAWGTDFNLPRLIAGLPQIWELGTRMFPPNLGILPKLVGPMIETLQMALWGTTIPIFLALPLAFLAATNVTPHRAVSAIARGIIGTLRTIPELVWAMLLVSAVGLGPFPGVIALTLHSIGGIGKFYYETIEAVNPGVMEAMEATGANRFKVIWYGVLPSVAPNMMSATLLYWEYNNRASTVLGLVGAGGIGLALTHAMQDFRYTEVVTCLALIVLILLMIDRLSAFLRARVI